MTSPWPPPPPPPSTPRNPPPPPPPPQPLASPQSTPLMPEAGPGTCLRSSSSDASVPPSASITIIRCIARSSTAILSTTSPAVSSSPPRRYPMRAKMKGRTKGRSRARTLAECLRIHQLRGWVGWLAWIARMQK